MLEMAIAGEEEFLLGFQLAGVSNTFKLNPDNTAEEEIREIMEKDGIGILVLHDNIMQALPEHMQANLNKSVSPVVVVLSEKSESSSLRDSIIKAIGVDLMKEK